MNYPKIIISALCMNAAGMVAASASPAASEKVETIRVISSMATRQILSELAGEFEKQTGCKVLLESVGGVDAARRVEAGEDFDVVILAAGTIDKLTDSGKIIPGSRTDLVKSGVAIAVKDDAPPVNIDNEDAVKLAVLQAKTIGYSTGPSGVYLAGLFERWGITEQIKDRIIKAPPGVSVGSLIAKGEVELGFQQRSELLHIKGISIAGPLPPEIQIMTYFSAGITTNTKKLSIAEALLTFLSAAEVNDVKIRNGMEAI